MSTGQRPVILTFGDSITQYGNNPELKGWTAGVAHWFERRADVINRGLSGYNTRWAKLTLEQLVHPACNLLPVRVGEGGCGCGRSLHGMPLHS